MRNMHVPVHPALASDMDKERTMQRNNVCIANAGLRLTPHVHVSRVEPWQRVDAVDELVLARRADAVQHGRREVGVGPERVDHLVEGAVAAQQLAYLWVG